MRTDVRPVLIVGGSVVGLTTAFFLASYGIPTLVVESHPAAGTHPRARGLNPRSMELFRPWDVEETLREGTPEIHGDELIVQLTSLAGEEIRRMELESFTELDRLSPTTWLSIGQDKLEPKLCELARERGAEVRYGHRMLDCAQDDDGVSATVLDRASGAEYRVRARYLVGADGHRGQIRELLGIGATEVAESNTALSALFRADLSEVLAGRNISIAITVGPGTRNSVLTWVEDDMWMVGFRHDAEVGGEVEFTEEQWVEVIRAVAGDESLAVEITYTDQWEVGARIADTYQRGRIFLAGDSAHLMPPSGAFGASTGTQDAQNLAWKLAMVLNGQAGTGLLDSYTAERQPTGALTVRQSALRARERRQSADTERLPENTVMLGYKYQSPAVLTEPGDTAGYADPNTPTGLPGSRGPHVVVETKGAQKSLLDLYGRGFVLLTGPDGTEWVKAGEAVAAELGIDLAAWTVGPREASADLVDVHGVWNEQYGVTNDGVVLLRPDGIIAWRSKSAADDRENELRTALERILSRRMGKPTTLANS
ncbi:putative polyketide hydroxylase [Tamaricihabitans halophyticus]|uniref:Putative polyketide hydroxylase n=1 Tax=Tamaricihabitans halophyticus TaxID=1262583 RepID=A0A4R2RAN8_9PSEU|nr:FAD-dependent monooxygenase [Tamaricihabitans halophyticus]TCP56771.1 putative polyketide hydroxylase [Tamaricihabitans halophyticus]